MISYIDYINNKDNKKNINESFNDKNMLRVYKLICSIINKHCQYHVSEYVGTEKTIVDGEQMNTKFFIVTSKDSICKMFALNFLRSDDSNEVYSIDFYDNLNILFKNKAKTKLSIYTLGSSIVYFLPVIWTVVDTGDFNLTKEKVTQLGKKIYLNESCDGVYKYYVGALPYYLLNNLNDDMIKEAFLLEQNEIKTARDFLKHKDEEKRQARLNKNNVPNGKEIYKRLQSETKEIWELIRGGVKTLDELKAAIKINVSVKREIDELTKNIEKEEKEQHEDPKFVFKKLEKYVDMVIKGINPSIILCGAPGVGKSYRVQKQLERAGKSEMKDNLFIIKGKCTARQLYVSLYEYRRKGDVLVIDDADGLVGPGAPEECINILKAALDSSSSDKGRLVTYGVTGKIYDSMGDPIDNRFYYNGSVIIITNWNAGNLDSALRGRSIIQDINFTTDDLLSIIRELMPGLSPDTLSEEAKKKSYDYLVEMAEKGSDMEISIRTFGICAKIFQTCLEDDEFSDEECKNMISEQMRLQYSKLKGKANKY